MKKLVVILGGGESGVGAALLAKHKKNNVFLSDNAKISDKHRSELQKNAIDFEEGKHSKSIILKADKIVKSPGISSEEPIVRKALKNNIPIVSDIDFAVQYTDAKLIGVSGSNGKTTTTMLIYHLLKNSGVNCGIAGNIGASFAKQVLENKCDTYILELSSFQLDHMYDTKLDIAILLNITPDHMDRYNYNFQQYVMSKFRLAQNMDEKSVFIYNKEDKAIESQLKIINKSVAQIPVSIAGFFNEKSQNLVFANSDEEWGIHVDDLPLKGKHNLLNIICAVSVCNLFQCDSNKMQRALRTFVPPKHRCEFVTSINGVEYYNDSKATNVNATRHALETFSQPLVWIVGGVDKGNDYEELEDLVTTKVEAIVILGKKRKKLIKSFKNKVNQIIETNSMYEAVEEAEKIAIAGNIVLLSPASASFDLFKNYEDRGEKFISEVNKIKKRRIGQL